MQGIITFIARLIRAGELAYTRKWSFFALFAIAFFGSVAILGELDLLPEPVAVVAPEETIRPLPTVETPAVTMIESPIKVEIPKIKLATEIRNPLRSDIEVLDAELTKGAVRYPTSAKLGEVGNMVLFGHSSYLPVVNNGAYKAFNDIQKLMPGDAVTVYSATTVYTYRVKSVTKESVDENKPIPLSTEDEQLTLVTCNSFATKSDRFVVVADLVESHPRGA